jgi:hypothetical protein
MLLTQGEADEASADPALDGLASTAPFGGPTPGLDAADVDLGLRYLTDFDVLVVGPEVQEETAQTAASAAGWAGAVAILVIPRGSPAPSIADSIVLEAPVKDPDGAFADLVGVYAAALDRGEAPDKALRSLAGSRGWERAEED